MSKTLYIKKIASPLGMITAASDGENLTGLWFEGQKHFGSTLSGPCEEKDLPVFRQVCEWLNIYFSAEIPAFTPPIRLEGTIFQLSVWKTLKTIPYGHTITYGEIAKALERQNGTNRVCARAVGGAVGRNPVSIIIPCHRVIGTNGGLTGYAGSADKKAFLLRIENADFKAE